jgi:membrane-associated phospholipid phosphatase
VPATVYHWLTPNQYAAMPSLHAAYPLLGALFALRLWGRRAWPTLAYTACVWLSIVYLGEHYIVDIIGAVIFVFAAFFGEDWFTQFWQQRRSQVTAPELAKNARSSS